MLLVMSSEPRLSGELFGWGASNAGRHLEESADQRLLVEVVGREPDPRGGNEKAVEFRTGKAATGDLRDREGNEAVTAASGWKRVMPQPSQCATQRHPSASVVMPSG